MRVRIVLDVEYDESTVRDPEDLIMGLEREIDRAVNEGFLTPSGEEVINQFDTDIREVK